MVSITSIIHGMAIFADINQLYLQLKRGATTFILSDILSIDVYS